MGGSADGPRAVVQSPNRLPAPHCVRRAGSQRRIAEGHRGVGEGRSGGGARSRHGDRGRLRGRAPLPCAGAVAARHPVDGLVRTRRHTHRSRGCGRARERRRLRRGHRGVVRRCRRRDHLAPRALHHRARASATPDRPDHVLDQLSRRPRDASSSTARPRNAHRASCACCCPAPCNRGSSWRSSSTSAAPRCGSRDASVSCRPADQLWRTEVELGDLDGTIASQWRDIVVRLRDSSRSRRRASCVPRPSGRGRDPSASGRRWARSRCRPRRARRAPCARSPGIRPPRASRR